LIIVATRIIVTAAAIDGVSRFSFQAFKTLILGMFFGNFKMHVLEAQNIPEMARDETRS
jgi:hypothetical protein